MLRLFPALDEVILSEWALLGTHRKQARHGNDDEILPQAYWTVDMAGPNPEDLRKDRLEKAGEMWYALPMQEMDAFSPVILAGWHWLIEKTAVGQAVHGMRNVVVEEQRRASNRATGVTVGPPDDDGVTGGEGSYFDRTARKLQIELGRLAKEPPKYLSSKMDGSSNQLAPSGMQWFPKISLMHIGTSSMVEAFQQERERTWREVVLQVGFRERVRYDSPRTTPHYRPSFLDPLVPLPWEPAVGWTIEQVQPPQKVSYDWSIAERGFRMRKDHIDSFPLRRAPQMENTFLTRLLGNSQFLDAVGREAGMPMTSETVESIFNMYRA